MTDKQVYKKTSSFIDSYNSEAKDGLDLDKGFFFFLAKHNARTKDLCPDAKLFNHVISVSEEDFFGAYGRRFKEKLKLNHNRLGLSSFYQACTVTILPEADMYFHNSAKGNQILRDGRLTRNIERATRRDSRDLLAEESDVNSGNLEDAAAKDTASANSLSRSMECTLQKAIASMGLTETAKLISALIRRNHCLTKELSALRASAAKDDDDILQKFQQHGAVIDLSADGTDKPAVTLSPTRRVDTTTVTAKPLRRVNLVDRQITIDKQTFWVKNVPNKVKLVNASRLTFLEKQDQRVATSTKSVSATRYTRNNVLADRLFAAALLSAPALSLVAAETFIPVAVAAHIAMTGQYDLSQLDFKCFPSQATLRQKLIEYAVDCLIILADAINDSKIFITCDKGNKKGLGHFVKVLAWWNSISQKVQTFVLDIDVSDGSSSKCADAIAHSMKKVKAIVEVLLRGQTTDSGGGGVLENLAVELQKRDLTDDFYYVANCTLHAIQLALSNPVKTVFGEGGLDPTTKEPKRNMPQMLHSVYDLQQAMEYSVFKMNYKEAIDWVEARSAKLQQLDAQETLPAQTDILVEQFDEDFKRIWRMARVVVSHQRQKLNKKLTVSQRNQKGVFKSFQRQY